jgi:hypothetical protein
MGYNSINVKKVEKKLQKSRIRTQKFLLLSIDKR